MWNTHRVGVTADNIVRYTASSLTVLQHSLIYENISEIKKTNGLVVLKCRLDTCLVDLLPQCMTVESECLLVEK